MHNPFSMNWKTSSYLKSVAGFRTVRHLLQKRWLDAKVAVTMGTDRKRFLDHDAAPRTGASHTLVDCLGGDGDSDTSPRIRMTPVSVTARFSTSAGHLWRWRQRHVPQNPHHAGVGDVPALLLAGRGGDGGCGISPKIRITPVSVTDRSTLCSGLVGANTKGVRHFGQETVFPIISRSPRSRWPEGQLTVNLLSEFEYVHRDLFPCFTK